MIDDKLAARLGWASTSYNHISSLIHFLSGNNRAFPFFISEADYPGIERYIFTAGLSLQDWLLF